MLTSKEIDDILYSIDATLANGFASPLTPYGEQVYSALREKLAQQKRHLTQRAADWLWAWAKFRIGQIYWNLRAMLDL